MGYNRDRSSGEETAPNNSRYEQSAASAIHTQRECRPRERQRYTTPGHAPSTNIDYSARREAEPDGLERDKHLPVRDRHSMRCSVPSSRGLYYCPVMYPRRECEVRLHLKWTAHISGHLRTRHQARPCISVSTLLPRRKHKREGNDHPQWISHSKQSPGSRPFHPTPS